MANFLMSLNPDFKIDEIEYAANFRIELYYRSSTFNVKTFYNGKEFRFLDHCTTAHFCPVSQWLA
jgi:hypothetical protein